MKRLTLFIVVLLLMSVAVVSAQGGPPAGVATHIIVFNSNVNPRAAVPEFANAYGLQVTNVYEHALNGMAAVVPAGRLNALARDPRVAYVEANMEIHLFAQTTPTGLDRSFAADNAELDIDGTDDYRVDVDVAVLDTGIDLQHPDLNIAGGIDCTLRSGGGPFANYFCGTGNGGDDDHYHGTHVAGTIGALDNDFGVVGIAPGARLWAVKVLNSQGSGYTSGIVAGIDWVVGRGDIEVINMSLGGSGISTAYKTAIDNAVDSGVVVVVAAGNSDADANNYSPAYVPSAITVSALADFDGLAGGLSGITCREDQDDTLADFSNWGSAVDIAAPGVCILSTYPLEQGEYGTISGTSMASPHVAGAAALLASGSNSPQNATDVNNIRNTLVNNGNLNWTDDSGDGIKERLLDLSNTTVFNPALIPGGGSGGGGGGTATIILVGDLDGTVNSSGQNWSATVSILVQDDSGTAVSGASVSGSFSTGNNGSCTTGSNGRCSVTSSNVRKSSVSSITFTVSNVSGSLPYSSSSNTDPDGDSDGTLITVTR